MQARDHDERVEQLRRRIEQLHELEGKWGMIGHDEMHLARTLQARAAEEMKRAQDLEEQGLLEDAAHVRARQAQLLDDAEELIQAAEDAVQQESATRLIEEHGAGNGQAPHQPRRPPAN
jgi:hypothetical protein